MAAAVPQGHPRAVSERGGFQGAVGAGLMRDLHHPAAPPPPPRRLEISGHRRVGQGSEMSQPSHPSLLPAVAEHRHVFTPPSTHSAPSITHPPLFAMLRPGSLLLRAQPPPRCRPSSSLELRLPLGSRSAPVSFAALFLFCMISLSQGSLQRCSSTSPDGGWGVRGGWGRRGARGAHSSAVEKPPHPSSLGGSTCRPGVHPAAVQRCWEWRGGNPPGNSAITRGGHLTQLLPVPQGGRGGGQEPNRRPAALECLR